MLEARPACSVLHRLALYALHMIITTSTFRCRWDMLWFFSNPRVTECCVNEFLVERKRQSHHEVHVNRTMRIGNKLGITLRLPSLAPPLEKMCCWLSSLRSIVLILLAFSRCVHSLQIKKWTHADSSRTTIFMACDPHARPPFNSIYISWVEMVVKCVPNPYSLHWYLFMFGNLNLFIHVSDLIHCHFPLWQRFWSAAHDRRYFLDALAEPHTFHCTLAKDRD